MGLGFDAEELEERNAPPAIDARAYFEASAGVVSEIAQQFETTETSNSDIDEQMSEVEQRLAKANLYRQVLNGNIFDGNDSLAAEVEAEFRKFAKQRLSVLLGLEQQQSVMAAQFSPTEAGILKQLVTGILGNAKLKSALGLGTEQVVAPPPKKETKLRTRPLPTVNQVRPIVKPVVNKTAPPPVSKPQVPQPKPTPAPKNDSTLLADGQIITEGNKTYKITWKELRYNEYGEATQQKIDALGVGGIMILGNGIKIHKSADDQTFKVLKLDITKQAKGGGGLPFPNQAQMTSLTAMHAAQSAANAPRDLQEAGELATKT